MAKKADISAAQLTAHEVLPRRWFNDSIRHTVVVCAVTREEQIVLVQPSNSSAHGWILPQGGINPGESLAEAAERELREELGWSWLVCDWAGVVHLGQYDHQVPRRGQIKRLYGVVVRIRRWQNPRLNGENRNFVRVGGPNHLWHLIPDCSVGKRQAMGQFLEGAVARNMLRGSRWQPDRLEPLMQLACS